MTENINTQTEVSSPESRGGPGGLRERVSAIGSMVKSALDFRGRVEVWASTPLPTSGERLDALRSQDPNALHDLNTRSSKTMFGQFATKHVLPPKS